MLVNVAMPDRTLLVDEDEKQLEQFVRVDYPVLVAALTLVCGSRVAAEDAVQEGLVKAVLAQRRGRPIESMPAWMRVVALNLLRNRWRSLLRERTATRRVGDAIRPSSGDAPGVDVAMDMQRAVARLPGRQREAVALYYRLDLSVAETASAMGVAEGTVKTLLSRARASLAVSLKDPEDTRA